MIQTKGDSTLGHGGTIEMPGALSAMAIPSVYPCLPISMPIAIPSDTDYFAVRMGAE